MIDGFVTVSEIKEEIRKEVKSFWGRGVWKIKILLSIFLIVLLDVWLYCTYHKIFFMDMVFLYVFPTVMIVLIIKKQIKADKKLLDQLNQYFELPYDFDGIIFVDKENEIIKIIKTKVFIKIIGKKEGEIEFSCDLVNWDKRLGKYFVVETENYLYTRSPKNCFYLKKNISRQYNKEIIKIYHS